MDVASLRGAKYNAVIRSASSRGDTLIPKRPLLFTYLLSVAKIVGWSSQAGEMMNRLIPTALSERLSSEAATTGSGRRSEPAKLMRP